MASILRKRDVIGILQNKNLSAWFSSVLARPLADNFGPAGDSPRHVKDITYNSSDIADVYDGTPKIPRGIFGRLDSKNPAVSKYCGIFDRTMTLQKSRGLKKSRDFRTTGLQKSCGLEKSRDFWTTWLWKSRGLETLWDFRMTPKIPHSKKAGFSDDDTANIPRSRLIAGSLDDWTPKTPRSQVTARRHSENNQWAGSCLPTSLDGWTQGTTSHWRMLVRTRQSKLHVLKW